MGDYLSKDTSGKMPLVPAVFAIATALPVIIIALILVQGVNPASGTNEKAGSHVKRFKIIED